MTDLTTTYMGLTLKNPIVPSASPLSQKMDGIRQMEDAGASAIRMYSLFEEQIDIQALAQHHFLEETTPPRCKIQGRLTLRGQRRDLGVFPQR